MKHCTGIKRRTSLMEESVKKPNQKRSRKNSDGYKPNAIPALNPEKEILRIILNKFSSYLEKGERNMQNGEGNKEQFIPEDITGITCIYVPVSDVSMVGIRQ
jgi:hypothetical protein